MKVKNICKKMASAFLAAVILTGSTMFPALAAEFPDMSGHWAEVNLQRAVEEEILNGFDDGTLRPDESITLAQALKIICSILNPVKAVDYSELGLTGTEWYAPYAAQSAYMGINFSLDGINDKALTRSEAFSVLAESFRIIEDEPDLSVLEGYADADKIPESAKGAFAALVRNGYVEGYNGYLNPGQTVSRAEFVSVLYRMAETVYEKGAIPATNGNLLISASAYIGGKTFTQPVWIGCSSGNVTLSGVKAETVIFLGQSGTLTVGYGTSIKKLVVEGARGSVSVNGSVERIEVKGRDTAVNIYSHTPAIAITGSGNSVYVGAQCDSVYLAGENNSLTGYGTAVRLMKNTATGTCTLRATTTIDHTDYGLANAEAELIVPEILPAGETLTVTAKVNNPETRECTAVWTVDGTEKKRENVTVGENSELSFTNRYKYTENMALESEISLKLIYTAKTGEVTSCEKVVSVALENHGEDYYNVTPEEALARVTCEYAGDYTTEWAEANDYPDNVKEIWVNAKGYSSKTEYLCWINLTYQRVNIFKGEEGSWELIHTFLGASGLGRNATPVGEYTVFGRSARGWKTSSYWCKPVVNFYVGTGYAFHSRLYHPTKGYLTEPDIGYPVSHGCIRMYDEDIQWIFDNIPNDTTVVVH